MMRNTPEVPATDNQSCILSSLLTPSRASLSAQRRETEKMRRENVELLRKLRAAEDRNSRLHRKADAQRKRIARKVS